jgi:hypothetical protein
MRAISKTLTCDGNCEDVDSFVPAFGHSIGDVPRRMASCCAAEMRAVSISSPRQCTVDRERASASDNANEEGGGQRRRGASRTGDPRTECTGEGTKCLLLCWCCIADADKFHRRKLKKTRIGKNCCQIRREFAER